MESSTRSSGYLVIGPVVDDRRLDVFRPGVGTVAAHFSRSPYEEGQIGIVGGIGLTVLFGDLYEEEALGWLQTDIQVILRGGVVTANANLTTLIPVIDRGGSSDLEDWHFQPGASVHLNGNVVSPGVFVRHPATRFTDGWVIGAEVRFYFL